MYRLLTSFLFSPCRLETNDTRYIKLEYTMRWSRDDLIEYLLDDMNLETRDEQEKSNMFDQATIFALKNDKQHALESLLERGTGFAPLDVGTSHCYLHAYYMRDDTTSSERISWRVKMAAAKFKRLSLKHKYLRWKVLASKPSTGTEIEHEDLKKALLLRISTDKAIIELKEDDFANGGIDVQDLSPASYVALTLTQTPEDGVVNSHVMYFKPDIGLEVNVDKPDIGLEYNVDNATLDIGLTSANPVAEKYFNAARNWAELIAHANKTNHGFHQLWQEHKRHCKSSPLMQSLVDGNISRAVTLLFNCRKNEKSSTNFKLPSPDTMNDLVAGCPVSQPFRMKLYRHFKMSTPKIGLIWKNMGDTKPNGRNLSRLGDSELAKALTLRASKSIDTQRRTGEKEREQDDCTYVEFTHQEWEAFDIKNLRMGDFVKAGDCYFSPHLTETLKSKNNNFKLYRQFILLETL
jgi:hypothetical protein